MQECRNAGMAGSIKFLHSCALALLRSCALALLHSYGIRSSRISDPHDFEVVPERMPPPVSGYRETT